MKQTVYALVDCNNFYVSCERTFNGALHSRPVLVLSNNDGCVVARSNESKALGIKMGQPVFECRELIEQHHIQVFSSNYPLYADMSDRVMQTLATFSPRVEVYSIDEAFLDLSHVPREQLHAYGHQIRETVWRFTGIPVSVGIASTKTLTKVANEVVKKNPVYRGVLSLMHTSEEELDELLETLPVEDVWGIGPRYTRLLQSRDILTAKDLKYAEQRWVRRHLTVVGERTVLELRGIACIPLETQAKPKKGIMTAKSFGRSVESREELEEAVATYTARAAEKVRKQGSAVSSISIFLHTNAFQKDAPQYGNSLTRVLPFPTSFTPDLFNVALDMLRQHLSQRVRVQEMWRVSFQNRAPGCAASRSLRRVFAGARIQKSTVDVCCRPDQRVVGKQHALLWCAGDRASMEDATGTQVASLYD